MFFVAPHAFLDLVAVVGDDIVRRLDDGLGGAVVLLQTDQLVVGIIVLEVEDILDVGATETVDRLGIVATTQMFSKRAAKRRTMRYCAKLVSWYSSTSMYLKWFWYL